MKPTLYVIFFFRLASSLNFTLPNSTVSATNSTVMSALNEIIRNHVTFKQIVMFDDELENSIYAQEALKSNWPKILIKYNFKYSKKLEGILLLFPNLDINSYSKVLKTTSSHGSLRYLIFTPNMINVIKIFDLLWSFKILDVAALYCGKTGLYVFTFYPFSLRGCSNTYPIQINKWDPISKEFVHKEKIFSRKNKLFNLNGCTIRASFRDKIVEEMYLKANENEVLKVFQILQSHLNFSTQVVEMDQEANAYAAAYFNFSTASIQSVIKGESDMGVGRYSQLIDFDRDIDSTVQMGIDCFTWAVPLKSGSKPSMWTMYAFEFDIITWIFLFISFSIYWAFFNFLVYCCKEDMRSYNFVYMFSGLVGVSVKIKPKMWTFRVFFIHWVLFCFVIVSAYTAAMGSLVTVPPDSNDIDSVATLLKTDLTLTGEPRMYHILSASSDTSETIREILDKFIILAPVDFDDVVYKLYRKRNLAIFYTKNKLELSEQNLMILHNLTSVLHIIPGCTITSHNSAVVMKKNSLFIEPFKYVLRTIVESGIVEYWSRKKYKISADLGEKANQIKNSTYTLVHAKGVFIVFAFGNLIAIFVFMIELLSKGVKQNRNK